MSEVIIIPAYNVEDNLPTLLNDLEPYKNNVLFIDAGSIDHTGKVVKDYGFNFIQNEKNIGLSKSIYKGLIYAKEKYYSSVILMDADGQHNPKYLPNIISKLNSYDFVFGSRFSSNKTIPTLKLNSNILASMIVNKIWRSNYFDISCGFKGFHLNEYIFHQFENSSGYQIVFDIFFYALIHKKRIGIVEMDAVYDNSKFLSTRKEELLAFLTSLKQYCKMDYVELKLDLLYEQIYSSKDFMYSIDGITFYGFFLSCKNTYIIQSDLVKLFSHLKEMEKINDGKRI